MSVPAPAAPDWSGLGFDPAPGDSGAVTTLSNGLRRVGQHLSGVHTALSRITAGEGEWTGEAARKFSERFGELPGYLQDASESITAAYTALDVWYQALTEHQPKAAELAAAAVTAKKKRDEADRAHGAAAASPDLRPADRYSSDDAGLAAAEKRYTAAKSHLDSAAELLDSATTELEGLRKQAHELAGTHRSDAGKTAEAVRKAADGKAPPEPGMLGRIGDWFKDHGADLLTVAAGVCGVAALFFPAFALPAVLFSAAAAVTHGAQYATKGRLWPPQRNIGNWLALGGDVLGAIPGVGVAAKGVTAAREAVAAGEGVRGVVAAGSTEVRAASRAIDPANPLFTKGIEKPARYLGVSESAAMDIADGVQAATTTGLAVPTAYGLTQDDPSDALTSGINYTTGGNNLIGSAGMVGGGGRANVLVGSVSTVGNLLGVGGWMAGHGR
ncbi:putative T7SS-secreted protein [Kitasatospora sp. NPDC056783]|uniref:putative T7SS-secreted protein n=1 Tax=Kitasatospora sp. NPDC056783 TaxID=3345943 RepID=UPI0036BC1165